MEMFLINFIILLTFASGYKVFDRLKNVGNSHHRNCGSHVIYSKNNLDAIVVGSGITGSTAGFYLHKNEKNIMIAEAGGHVGGNLVSKSGRASIFFRSCNMHNIVLFRGWIFVGRRTKFFPTKHCHFAACKRCWNDRRITACRSKSSPICILGK